MNAQLFSLFKLFYILVLSVLAMPAFSGAFMDNFDDGHASVINETGAMAESLDSRWWLNSGGYIYRTGNTASTIHGDLVDTDPFRVMYSRSNPSDTDNGYHPQNLLRWVTRAKFKNFTQQVFFNINKINLSTSSNRNQSNGVFFFHRYQDGKNLYYLGIRVDGAAVIKKKLDGQYYTLKSVQIYPGNYHHDTLPNLLPTERWIGLRTVIRDKANDMVSLVLYLNDKQLGPGWTKVIEVDDTGSDIDTLMDEGYAGIRTDFMDVSFDDYEAIEDPR